MTMVAGCRFPDGVVIIADSRVTWGSANIYSDSAQKILYLSPKLAIAFAGRVDLAEVIVRDIRGRLRKNPRIRNPRKLSSELRRVARFYYQNFSKKYRASDCSVSFILGGVESSGSIFLWAYNYPNFNPEEINKGYAIIGSGAIVAPHLEKTYHDACSKTSILKDKANMLLTELEGALQKHGVPSVGGLFQVILIFPEGISPMTYGFMDLTPENTGIAKEMTMSKGKWVQKDLKEKRESELVEPTILIQSLPKEGRFHDYELPKNGNKKELRWYLNYFITCLRVERQVSTTKFEGVLSQIGAFNYPRTIPILASCGFWGPRGKYEIKIIFDDQQNKFLLHSDKISILYPEQQEIDVMVELKILKPGPVFLEFHISDCLLARKALYFGKPAVSPPSTKDEFLALKQRMPQELIEQHRQCSDQSLSGIPCFLDYFIACEKFQQKGCEYVFENEIKAVYWKNYPLLLKTCIISGFRFSKGKHDVRIDLTNAATGETTNLTSDILEGSSECLVSPVEGDFVIKIPQPGLYFLNLYVDSQFISSILLPAETDKPKYSYSLRDEDLARVSLGELLILVKRSQSAEYAKEKI